MSSANALQLATTIQGRVGSSLLSVNSMLPPPEAAAAVLQAGGGSLGVFLLKDLAVLQEKTYQCVEKVASVLQSQLDLSEEAERRERDQAAELAKENSLKGSTVVAGGGGGGSASGINDNLDDIEESIDKGRFADLLGTGLTAALLTPQFLKNVGTGLGKKLLKGTMYATIAGFIADPVINYINTEFDLELDEEAKKDIKLSMIGAGVGLGLAGIPGAIIGATAPMIAKVAGYISGSLNATEVKDSDFAATAIGGAAASMWTVGKLGALMGASKIGAVATFGAAIGALPVIIGVGAAVALGVGAMYLAKKIDEYQELTLQKLEKTTAKLDKEMGEWAAREEEGLFERFGMNLGRLSALGEASVASSEASEQLGQDKAKFMADDGMQTKLVSLADTMLKYSDDALKGILTDSTKASNFFNTVENLKSIAAKGGFGSQSKEVFEKLSAFSDRIQNYAGKLVTEGVTGGKVNAAARNLEGIGGDQLENVSALEAEKKQLLLDRELKLIEIENAKKELQRLNDAGIESKFFGVNDAEKMEDKIKSLENELNGRNNAFNIDNKIKGVENKLNKMNTLNGLMYNLTELKELYSDNPERLQAIIERSVNQQGAEFLKESKTKNQNDGSITPIVLNNNGGSTTNNASQNNYIKKLDIHGDPYIAREGYVYGL